MIPLRGFSPDIDPSTTGAIIDCLNIVPTDKGFKPLPTAVSQGIDALPATCLGSISVRRTDGTKRTFAGTASNLYDLASGAWTSQGSGYTLGSNRWSFGQMGNVTLAAAKSETLQASIATTFSAIATAPKADLIETVAGFVMLANYSDATDTPDGWYCSGYQDYTQWTTGVNQCAKGRLLDVPGKCVALRRLGDTAIIYKSNAIFVGQYQGPPTVWSWYKVNGDIGTLSQGAVLSTGSYHLFIGNDDIYRMDGSGLPTPLNAPLKRWLISRINYAAVGVIQSCYDPSSGIAWWFYPSTGSTIPNEYIALNINTGEWGYGQLEIESVLNLISESITYDSPIMASWTYDTMSAESYDSTFWTADSVHLSIFDTTHTPKSLSGPADTSSLTLWDIGADDSYTLLKRLYLRLITQPSSAILYSSSKYDNDDSFSLSYTDTMSQGRIDFMNSALWHRLKIDFTGDYELIGIDVDTLPDGFL